jgi:hypothetical protein
MSELSITQTLSTHTQDIAAGGIAKRKLKINNGDIVTVSIVCTNKISPYSMQLRFKNGPTYNKTVGKIEASSERNAIKEVWSKVKKEKFCESFGWEWINKTL